VEDLREISMDEDLKAFVAEEEKLIP